MQSDIKTVWIVDDETAVLTALTRVLNVRGYQVEAFASSREFLEKFDPTRRACLLVDLRIPDMNGLELQQELNSRGISMPILFMSGHGGTSHSNRALVAGAIGFLKKPFSIAILLESLSDAFAISATHPSKNG